MISVKWTMFNLHFWCMSLDWSVTILTVPFLLFPAMAGYPLGVLTDFGVRTDFQVYLVITLLFTVVAAVVTIFENRYFQIFSRDKLWKRFRIPFLGLNYLLSFTFFIPALITVPEQGPALEYVFLLLPDLPQEVRALPIFVLAIDYRYVVIPIDAMAVLMSTESFVFVWLIYKNMNEISKRSVISIATFRMQKKFLNAVYMQVAVFFINIIIPLIVVLNSIVFNFYNQAANNLCFIFLSCHGLSSTIIMLWAHKPYRKVCMEFFEVLRPTRIFLTIVARPSISNQEETRQRSVMML